MKSFVRAVMVGGFAIGVTAIVAPGCGNDAGDLCALKCDCELCSDYQYESCLRDADREVQEADYRGCLGFYDDYLACQDATGFCDGYDWETSCKPERERYRDCMDGK